MGMYPTVKLSNQCHPSLGDGFVRLTGTNLRARLALMLPVIREENDRIEAEFSAAYETAKAEHEKARDARYKRRVRNREYINSGEAHVDVVSVLSPYMEDTVIKSWVFGLIKLTKMQYDWKAVEKNSDKIRDALLTHNSEFWSRMFYNGENFAYRLSYPTTPEELGEAMKTRFEQECNRGNWQEDFFHFGSPSLYLLHLVEPWENVESDAVVLMPIESYNSMINLENRARQLVQDKFNERLNARLSLQQTIPETDPGFYKPNGND